MSFGFSVGDVILLSQMSYQIYQSITNGRKNASRDLAELGDVLFGLQCALDHLHHAVEDISKAAISSYPQAGRDAEMRTKLDKMVTNCATTLEDLVSVTKKYREGVQQHDAEDDGASSQSSLTRTDRIKRRLASNVMKIRWDIDKDTLRVYREKLQTHTDAINLVLNTFIWSSSKDMRLNHQVHTQQLTALHDKVVSSNSELEKLIKDIHAAVTQKTKETHPVPMTLPERPGRFRPTALMATCDIASDDVHAYFATIAPTPTKVPQRTTDIKSKPGPNLPPSIISLNARRQDNAMRFVAKQKKLHKITPPQRPSCFNIAEPTIDGLTQGLNYMFWTNKQTNQDISKDINTWVRLLSNLLDLRISNSTSRSAVQHEDLLELLAHLNDKLEEANEATRKAFYRTSAASCIEDTLQRIVASTRSVRVEQAVEEFMDVRQEWLELQE